MLLLLSLAAGLLVLLLAYFRLAAHFNIIDKPNQRSSHTGIIIRGGGIVFYLGVLFYSLFQGFPYPWFLAGITLIAGISFADDIRPVASRIRLVFHFAAMLLMFYQWGLFAGMPLWYLLLALVFCTGIINAYNFMDGINGITGGYSLVVLGALAFINRQQPFTDAAFLYIALLSVLIFNFFNFRKKARCFAGDVGSVSIAFIILFALGQLIIATHDLSYIVLLLVYGVDSVLTIVHRLMLHENIFEAHRKHAYQLMANELKISHVKVSLLYMLLQGLIIAGFLWLFDYKWLYFGAVLLTLSAAYLWFQHTYFHLHQRS